MRCQKGLGSCHQPGASSPLRPEEGAEGLQHTEAPSSPSPSTGLHRCLLQVPASPVSIDQTPAELRYSQEGEFGRGGIHQATAPGAVHQVPSPLQEHGIPGVVKLPGEALPRLVAKALGVARHGHALHPSDPGAGHGR